MSTKLIKLCIW